MSGVLYQGTEPVSLLLEGGPAMWEGKTAHSPYVLVYEFGDWSVSVPCDRSDFDGLDAWVDGLQGRVTSDGFLILDATRPIVREGADSDLSYGPGFTLGGSDGFIVLTLGTKCDAGARLLRDDDSAQWCSAIGDGAVEITVQTPRPSPDGGASSTPLSTAWRSARSLSQANRVIYPSAPWASHTANRARGFGVLMPPSPSDGVPTRPVSVALVTCKPLMAERRAATTTVGRSTGGLTGQGADQMTRSLGYSPLLPPRYLEAGLVR